MHHRYLGSQIRVHVMHRRYLGSEKQFNEMYGKRIKQSRNTKCSAVEQEAGQAALDALHRQVDDHHSFLHPLHSLLAHTRMLYRQRQMWKNAFIGCRCCRLC